MSADGPGDLSAQLRRARILAIEGATARAWPALDVADLEGWRLHGGAGKVMRTNSCWPMAWRGSDVNRAIAAAEAWYARLGLSPAFKLVDGAVRPESLPDALARRGYRPFHETLVLTAPLKPGSIDPEVAIRNRFDADFAAVLLAAGGDLEDAKERASILGRVPQKAGFAVLRDAAAGLGVVDRDHLGVMAMRTAAGARRRGFARRILTTLLAWGVENGARTAYLQVEASNTAARALYERERFSHFYSYRYWLK